MTRRIGNPDKPDFLALVRDIENTEYFLPKDAVEAREGRMLRESRLETNKIRTAITPEDYRAIVRGTLDLTKSALRMTRGWVDSVRGSRGAKRHVRYLSLVGEKGLGKTVAAAWAIAELGGYYLSANALRELAESRDWRDAERRQAVLDAALVVLDDLGTESLSPETQGYVHRLIDERQSVKYGTIITTNLDGAAIEARYGDRAWSRLSHQGAICDVIGDSMRMPMMRVRGG